MASSKEYLHFILGQLSDLEAFLTKLFEAMYDELPVPKRKSNMYIPTIQSGDSAALEE